MAPWIPPPAIPAKNDGDPLTAKDLKDVVASLQAFLIGGMIGGPASSLSGAIPVFSGTSGSILTASKIVWADPNVSGSIQLAVDSLPSSGGAVVCEPGALYSQPAKVWLHSGVTLFLNGATLKRATGSITDGDANLSGNIIGAGPKGSNGTQFSSGAPGSNVSIIGPGVLDGNYTNFTSLTNTNLALSAVRILWVDGVTIDKVTAQNCLEDGFYFSNIRNHSISNIRTDTVGQWSVVSSRNAVSFMNNDNVTTYANQGTLTGFRFNNTGDEAITSGGSIGLCVSNGSVDGADFGIEFTSTNTVGYTDCTFENIAFKNLLSYGVTIAPSAAVSVQRMQFSHMTFEFHPSLHDAGVLYMAGSTYDLVDCRFSHMTAVNVNSKDTTSRTWIDVQSAAGKLRKRLTYDDLKFVGMSASTRTGDVAFSIRYDSEDVEVRSCLFKYVAGIGVSTDDAVNGQVTTRTTFFNVTVDESNGNGFQTRNNSNTATQSQTRYINCTAHNTAKLTGNCGFNVEAGFAGSTLQDTYLIGCRSYGSQAYGAQINQGAGTLDNTVIDGCDFSGCATDWMTVSGSPTNVHFRPRPGRGSDIASAATITIPLDGDSFHVTGTTNIGTINTNPLHKGRRVKLIFDGALTMTAPVTNVKMGGNYTTTADDSWTLTNDGTNWNEDSRSVNA